MSNSEQQHDLWEDCPPGELTRMVQRVDAAQRRARTKQVCGTALVSTAVFACVVLAVGSLMGPNTSQHGGIACSFCRDHLADYQQHVTGESVHEDAAFVTSMQVHLEKCTFCRSKFNSMYPGLLSASHPSATRPVVLLAMRPMFAVRSQQSLY